MFENMDEREGMTAVSSARTRLLAASDAPARAAGSSPPARRADAGRTPAWKKAIVRLKDGDSPADLF